MALFGGPKQESVALVDITSSSVGAAYARIAPGRPVAMLYSVRVPLPETTTPAPQVVLFRALDEALHKLRTEGAPILRRRTGSGAAAELYANVGGTLQDTQVRIETITDEKPFIFSAADLEAAKKRAKVAEKRVVSEDYVLATLLNGYLTASPLGKKATRAEIIMLSASLEEETATLLRHAMAGFSTRHDVRYAGFASCVRAGIAVSFPHEKDYLALRVSGGATELMHVARGYPSAVARIDCGLSCFADAAKSAGHTSFPDGGGAIRNASALSAAQTKWVGEVAKTLKDFTATRALPRTMFLLADPDAADFLRTTLNAPELHALWLSDEPLSVITMEGKQLAGTVAREPNVLEDLPLELLALAARERLSP